jgi:hypothetical protein
MAKANPAQAKLIRSEVARLLTSGSKRRLDVVSAARQEDHDLIVSIPQEGSGVLGVRIETTSRLSKGRFGEWLVIEAAAPAMQFRRDARASYVFGQFSVSDKKFTGPIFVVPSSLVGAVPGAKGKSPRISFRARLDAVNQEWSDFAVRPDALGAYFLDLLSDSPEAPSREAA